jgi:beta-lactamase class A
MKIIIIAALLLLSNILNASVLDKLKQLESHTDGRLGVFAINTEDERVIEYRANEFFPTGCTSKVIGVAAVLQKSMFDPTLLSQKINYTNEELVQWSPITQKNIAIGMTIEELCAASISFSDNTAMNLLLQIIGGVQGMNDFARSIGNFSFSQDNAWLAEAYSGGAHNTKDASTPKSMVESLRQLTMGEVLDKPHRDLLLSWLIQTQTGAHRIPAAIPADWVLGHKTGTGAAYGTTNDLAILFPPNHAPILIGIYYTSDNEHAKVRDDVVAAATRIIIDELRAGCLGIPLNKRD